MILHSLRVQEISGDDRREAGRIPRTIECELTSDLVDSCVPGDMVTITAVVKATGSEEGVVPFVALVHHYMKLTSEGLVVNLSPSLSPARGRNTKDKCMFLLYLYAVSVSNNKGSGDASHGLHMEFSTKVVSGVCLSVN